jgi:hypothetical protein
MLEEWGDLFSSNKIVAPVVLPVKNIVCAFQLKKIEDETCPSSLKLELKSCTRETQKRGLYFYKALAFIVSNAFKIGNLEVSIPESCGSFLTHMTNIRSQCTK